MAKKRGKGTFVKSRTASFEDDRRPLKRCGEVHRLYCSFSPQVRRDLLNDIGLSHLRRVGHRRKVELLRRATTIDADFLAIDEFVCSRDQRLGVTMSGAVFGPRLTQMLEQAIKILGANSARPSVGQLEAMCDSLAIHHRSEWIKLFLAAVVEARFPSHPEVIELDGHPEWGGFVIDEEPNGDGSVMGDAVHREVDPEIKRQRWVRRRMERDERAARQRQREEGKTLTEPKTETQSDLVVDKPQGVPGPSRKIEPPIEVRVLEHPRLPKGASISKGDPVGKLYWAYIAWGPDRGQGKVRPVLVVGASISKVWVRPCYSEDFLAGRWRAVEILDWPQVGLTKGSYVSIGLVKLSRKSLRKQIGTMSLNDWNRVCRGEVHG